MIATGAASAETAALSSGEVRELVSIGFHGLLNGKPEPALRLFDGLSVLRPSETFPLIGWGLALMASGRVHEAVRILEKAQALKPHDDDVRVFLGMALRLANHEHHARAVLATMAQGTGDTPVVRLARGLCELPA